MTGMLILRSSCMAALVSILLGAPRPCIAQLEGRVTDTDGNPVPGVLVELWGPLRRLAAASTDGGGGFKFGKTQSLGATVVLLRRRGFQVKRRELSGIGRHLEIEMLPITMSLSPVTVIGESLCPNAENPGARGVWEALRQKYRQPGAGFWAETLELHSVVSPGAFGTIDTARLQPGQMQAGGEYFALATQLVMNQGYAKPATHTLGQRFDSWEYPRLESVFAGHFIDDAFGQLHLFSFSGEVGDTSLVFCPRRTDRPYIEGHLHLGGGLTLASASWRFFTPAPEESVGGEVVFAAPEVSSEVAPLIPISGFYWRKRVSSFYHAWSEYRAWHDCTTEPNARLCGRQ
jgi:hypothetical protein